MPHPHTVWDVRSNGAFRAWLLSLAKATPSTTRVQQPSRHRSANKLARNISEACDPPIFPPLYPYASATAKWRWTAKQYGVGIHFPGDF